MGKIGKIMMVVFMFGLLAGPVFGLSLVSDIQAVTYDQYGNAIPGSGSGSSSGSGLTMPNPGDVGYAGTETDFITIVEKIVKWVVGFIVLMSIFMFAYGGLTYLTAGGDETKVENAKKALVSALFGLLIAALSYAIVQLIIGFVTQ